VGDEHDEADGARRGWPARDPRRTVMVVSAGLALAVLAAAVNRSQALSHGGGWFAYSPNTGTTFSPDRPYAEVWREAGVWVLAIAAWTGIALWVYRRRA
jgi:hypothetical protein